MTARTRQPRNAQQPSRLLKPVRIVRTHNRLFAAIALGIVVYLLLPGSLLPGGWKLPTRILVGWNSGALTYLAIAAFKAARFDLKAARSHAAAADEGAWLVLFLTIAASAASLAAVVAEIGTAKDAEPFMRAVNLGLAALTIVLSWSFIQTIFAFHYAHEFYGERGSHKTGLSFPECKQPEYWEFLYFSFVIGMTFQVSDVQVTSAHVRRTVLAHGIVAFFFNLAVLSLAINIGGSLI
jgi:uncharacterized membrane protein